MSLEVSVNPSPAVRASLDTAIAASDLTSALTITSLAIANVPADIDASPPNVVQDGSPFASATNILPFAPAAKADGYHLHHQL